MKRVHGDEGKHHRDGDGDDGHDGRGDVPEEKEDHQGDDDHFHDQLFLQVVDGPPDQVGAVVGGHQLNALGHGSLEVLDFGLHALDDVEGVLAVPHHHDAAHHVAQAVEFRQSPPYLGAQRHRGHVFQEHRRAPIAFTATLRRSSTLLMYPLPRTMYSLPDHSMSRPPTSLLFLLMASMTSMRDML